MNRFLPLGAIALATTIGVAACSGATAAAPASDAHAANASAATAPVASLPATTPPAVDPSPSAPAASERPAPSPDADDAPDGAKPIHVNLANAVGDNVSIDVQDESGHVVGATSGTPGDGASVAWRQLKAENVDARTLRFTWTAMPGDDRLGFYVSENAKVALVLPAGRGVYFGGDATIVAVLQADRDGDSMAFDRVLIAEFDRPVDASELTLGVQDGLDTAG